MARTIGIRVFKGDELQGVHTFERDIIKIGRLASAHLRLEDPKVSRIHAVIDIAAGREEVSIIDMGSAEGTRVNGEKISRVQVKHGDEVGLGDSRLVVVLEESEVAALTGDDEAPAPTAVGQETEAIPGRGQLSSLPEPENRETDVFSGGDVAEGGEGALTEEALAELRSSTAAPTDTGVFEGASIADAPIDDDGGAFAAGAGGSHAEGEPQPQTQPPMPAGSQPPMMAQGSVPPMVAPPLPPIPEDPVTPANRFVELELRWSGSIVDVKRVREEQSFTVGVLGSCDMFLPMEDVGGGPSFELLSRAGDEWVLNITPQMGGSVRQNGQSQPLASAAGGGGLTLGDGVEVELSIGYFTLVVKTVSKSKVIPIVPLFDMFMINTALVTLFGMVSLISAMLLAPVGLDDGSDDLLENSNQFQTILLKQPKKNEFLEKFKEKQKSKQTKSAQGKNSKAGKKTVKKNKTGKMAVKAPKKPTDAEVVAAKMKALGLSGESGGIAAIFGPTNGGGELEAALGNISGNKVAAAYGAGGLGVRGAAPGGGGGVGVGTVGIGRVGTLGRGSGNASYGGASGNLGARSDRAVKISSGKPLILGSLDKEIIRRVVREHMAQIKYCYERELTKTPGIYGKIVMKWIINGQGRVTQTKVAETQMKNKNVESCIGRKIRTWRFPKPKGGGIVIVNYPFVFKQSN